MRLVPVNFSLGKRTILQTNRRETLQLSPVPTAEALLKFGKIADTVAGRDTFDAVDLTDDFEGLMIHVCTP